MTVDISTYLIATPLPVSDTNPVALELMGAQALIDCPTVIQQLEDGSVQLSAPTLGASSKSTHRTRCEWKDAAYWALDSAAHHWSRQELTLLKVNSAEKVVVAQIHVKGATTPPLKVFWDKGKLRIGFRASFVDPAIASSTLLYNVPLNTPFKIAIHATLGGSVSVTVSCEGNKVTSPVLRLDASWKDQLFQFHGGIYNQVDYTEETSAEDGSVCVISSLVTTHGA
jgi:hypothetical protein